MGLKKIQKRKAEEVFGGETEEPTVVDAPEKPKNGKNVKEVAVEAGAEVVVEKPKKKKLKKAKKAVVEAVAEEEAKEVVEKPKNEKKAKRADVEAVAEEEAEEVVEKPKKKKKAKKAAVEAVAAEEAEEVVEKPRKEKKGKKAKPVEEAASEEDEAEDVAEKPKTKGKRADAETAAKGEEKEATSDTLTVYVGGIPFSCAEETLRDDFAECGEIEKLSLPMNDEGRPKGFAFITYKTKEGVEAALKFDGDDYGGRTLKVNLAGQGPKGGSGKGEKGTGKGNNELTAFVRGLPFETQEEELRKVFAKCGEIESARIPLNDEGRCKGIAFIEFKAKEALEKAKELSETDFGGRTMFVSQAGEGGKGKGKDGKGKGKDGKGKGKDGKGKGKDGKGKGKKGKF